MPIRDINKVINDTASNKVADKNKIPQIEQSILSSHVVENESKDGLESKTEVNLNGKMMKFSESRKSPVIGNFTFHSTPNKEGKPLTKTMVDLQLHPSRHSDNIKKTIEVHTDNCKQKCIENQTKHKDCTEQKEADSTSAGSEETSMGIESKSEENMNIGTNLNKSDKTSLKDKAITILDASYVCMPEANQGTEITVQHDQSNVPEKDSNNILEQESLEHSNKDIILECKTGDILQENLVENSKDIEIDDSVVDISKVEITEEKVLSNVEDGGSDTKCETYTNCSATDPLQKTSFSQDEQTQINKEDNKPTLIKDHTYDVFDKEITKENNSMYIAKSGSVPNDNETINLDKDLKENNIIQNFTKVKNILSESSKSGSKNFKEDNEVKDEIGVVITKEVDKNKIIKEKPKDVVDQYINESSVQNRTNEKNNEISSSKETTIILEVDVQKKNNDVNNSQQLIDSDKSVPLREKSTWEQTHLIVKSNESAILKDDKSSRISININHPKADNEELANDNEFNTNKDQTLLKRDSKVIDYENRKAENSNQLKPLKNIEETLKLSESEVPVQTEKKLELESNDTQKDDDSKSINNNSAVPFGKWTEANRQEFLNKIKGSKTLVHSSNNKAIKNSNDLNRRDVLKKIDKQRHTSTALKLQDLSKINSKSEIVFTSKSAIVIEETNTSNTDANLESQIPPKPGVSTSKTKDTTLKKSLKQETTRKSLAIPTKITATVTSVTKKESVQRKAVKDLIDKTIEGMIIKAFPSKPTSTKPKGSDSNVATLPKTSPTTLDAIEMKMNELHGIPFIERPPHELPKVNNPVPQSFVKADLEQAPDKINKEPKLLSIINKNPLEKTNDNVLEFDSEEEVIEHEPVTGDIELKNDLPSNLSLNENSTKTDTMNLNKDNIKKESIITEKDFDKFARRNSVTFENCLTVNFEKQEPLNVVKTVIELDKGPKNYSKNEVSRIESKQNRPSKIQNLSLNKHCNRNYSSTKLSRVVDDPSNKNYHSKLQIAYQSALTAKRQLSCPIDIIEDQPVKVVFMDAKTEFVPNLLNIQGQKLSPSEKKNTDITAIRNTTDSVDSDLMDTVDEEKTQEDVKLKTKHQRKQVLTPVEAPELELIEPRDLGIDVSPKKKRKTEDIKAEKTSKNLVHKKSYLLGRTVSEDKVLKTQNFTTNEPKLPLHREGESNVSKDTVTAIDSLVKAAELLDNQSETTINTTISNPESVQGTTPVKRGRGRPRKYPLPDGTIDKTKVPSPHKKPRLIDARSVKRETEDEESSDEGEVKENWTMGKINENIVCPICNKLFRSENVIFKHVKHCSGPSPNRSDTSKRSIRKGRSSQGSDDKSHESQDEMDVDESSTFGDKDDMLQEHKLKDSISNLDKEVIVIEDKPIKEKPKNHTDEKQYESRLPIKKKVQITMANNLECEFCGKTFRQLSYLANHKLHHKKELIKKIYKNSDMANQTVFACELCNKEFRKLHHLAQHRITHNPNTLPTKLLRKKSYEQPSNISEKEEISKQSEDASAGFRCEPCDKSFRKLHHLVEHRETHDGINRQKITYPEQVAAEKPESVPPPQCDICKKTFRKLHHLIEHKEQHVETSSEKSDDKSVKSSLSTKDIIHECSLCYMVFPNEHSLNKHTIICQKKKRQSKQPKPVNENGSETIETDSCKVEQEEQNKIDDADEPEIISDDVKVINLEKDDNSDVVMHKSDLVIMEDNTQGTNVREHHLLNKNEDKKIEIQSEPVNMHDNAVEANNLKVEHSIAVAEKHEKIKEKDVASTQENPKKKILRKDKVAPLVTKRQKKFNVSLPTVEENKPLEEMSDDDEVRYMLNPDYKPDDVTEDKLFLKVKAKKRNSLQIERPNSKDLIKRRTSLQHPPKIPRLKAKPIERKPALSSTSIVKNIPKNLQSEPTPSTDSDDSDVKYSFPVKTPKPVNDGPIKEAEKKTQRKSLEQKRKSLGGIAKRKSLGKVIGGALPKVKQSSIKQVKRR